MSQQDSTITTARAEPFSLGEALFGFYSHTTSVYLRPSVARFTREAGNARWGTVWIQILVMTLLTAILAFCWGRLSLFTPAATVTRPLPITSALIITFTVPVMTFVIGGLTLLIAKSLDGQGTFLTQTYTGLLIGMPIFLLSMIVLLASLHIPALGGILLVIDFLFMLYGVVLQVFAMMAVHRVSAWKAILIVISQTISILAVILVIAVVFIATSVSSNDTTNGSNTNKKSDTASKKTDTSTSTNDFERDSSWEEYEENRLLYPGYPVYPVYPVYRTQYIQSNHQNTPGAPLAATTPVGEGQPSATAANVPTGGSQVPSVALTEASCPSCYYTEWAAPLRIKDQLPCIHCGTQMISTSNDHRGEPPKGYFEVQCPQCNYHEWTAQHRLDAGVTCVNCGAQMQPTGNSW